MQTCTSPVAIGTKLSKDDEGSDVNPTLFKILVGSVMYLTTIGPDIMQGTRDYGIMYASTEKKYLIRFTNSDFVGSLDDRKSTSGYVFHLGSGVITWASKKQPIVTLSSVDAEYVVATSTTCQEVWLRRVLDGLK